MNIARRLLTGVLVIVCLPLSARGEPESLAGRFPAGALHYAEVQDLDRAVDLAQDSAVARAISTHPVVQQFWASPPGRRLAIGLGVFEGAAGMNLPQFINALGGSLAVAAYAGETGAPRYLLAVRTKSRVMERFVSGIEAVTFTPRTEVEAANAEQSPLWRVGKDRAVFVFHEGDLWIASGDRSLAETARRPIDRSLAADPRIAQARRAYSGGAERGATLFAVLDGTDVRANATRRGKPENVVGALVAGALTERLARADWVGLGLAVDGDAGGLSVALSAILPRGAAGSGATEAAFGGELAPLPIALATPPLAEVRLHRDLSALWEHRDELISSAGLPQLVKLETNFGVVSGGLDLVEEFLPALAGEISLVAFRPEGADGLLPSVRYPEAALLVPLRNAEALAPSLAIGFQTLVGISNAQRAQNGDPPLATTPSTYKGVTLQTARFLPPSEAEMSGRAALPARFNFSPTQAVVNDMLVIGTSQAAVRRVIDGRSGSTPVSPSTLSRIDLAGGPLRATLEDNREPLIARSMLARGTTRSQAEGQVDLALAIADRLETIHLAHREPEGADVALVDFELHFSPAEKVASAEATDADAIGPATDPALGGRGATERPADDDRAEAGAAD